MFCAGLKRNLAYPAEVFFGANHHGGFGVAYEVFNLCALVRGVERQKNKTSTQGREVENQGLDRFLYLHGHARPFWKFQ